MKFLFVGKWISLEIMVLSGLMRTQKILCISLICGSYILYKHVKSCTHTWHKRNCLGGWGRLTEAGRNMKRKEGDMDENLLNLQCILVLKYQKYRKKWARTPGPLRMTNKCEHCYCCCYSSNYAILLLPSHMKTWDNISKHYQVSTQ